MYPHCKHCAPCLLGGHDTPCSYIVNLEQVNAGIERVKRCQSIADKVTHV